MNPFSLSSAPLEGANLIEASAGTGKTYTLTGLFLRLLVEQGLRIDQVLVVTYTNAATAELKERIRDGLRKAKSAFKQQDRSDDRLAELMDAVPDINLAIHRINDALVDFDRAAIYTIHGFCQRILQSYAFETGSRFHTELIQDASQLVQQTVDDFWRRYISTAPRELAAFAVDKVGSPERLAEILAYSRHSQIKIIPETEKPSLSMIKQWRHATSAIVNQWADARKIIKELLEYEGLNARYYGKCAQVDHASSLTHRQIRIDALCDALDRWEGQYPLFAQFDRFSTSYLHKATKKGYKAPQHPFFDACETALQCHQAMEVQLAAFTQYLKARLVSRTQRQLAQKKAFQNIQFFDDLLLQVHDALTDKGGPRLVRAVRSQYRAALVDEFQDTDPLQYRIFLNLFAEPPHLLVMIGDPKQAIYGFRGADLFSYIQAVEHADHRATLTRNWRSTPALVGAVNAIKVD